ncbi:MAG: hypothetical protein HUU49_01935 [Candidatus Buchananbacteria bacterium]|nr:hypothetical protein [Candidatus Buchananbacteria bacterium]
MKKLSQVIRRLEKKNRGDYLVFMKKGLAWKYYREQQLVLSARRSGI